MSKVLIIIPTYNEIENIEAIIAAVMARAEDIDILIVDDGSPDGTGDKVKSLKVGYKERLHLIERQGKLGLGTAYIAGFKYALGLDYDLVVEMDADFSHNPKDVNRLIETCRSSDEIGMVVGSRYVKGGGFKNWNKYRLMLSFTASLYTRIITGMPVKDPTAGFVIYKRKVLEQMDLEAIKFIGYAFQIEMKYYCFSLGYKIVEIPITFIDRELGTSKMNMSIVQEGIFGVLQMRFRKYKSNSA